MKMINSAPILGLVMLLSSFSLFAQEDLTKVSSTDERIEDSLTVVVPESGSANLKLIIPPEGFEPTDKFNGYLHPDASSGIIMTMIENSNYIKIDEGMTEAFYNKNSLVFIEKNDFISDNGIHGIYYKCSFVINETPFVRYIVYAGDLNKTLWLNITYPTKLEHLVEGELLKCIQTISLKADRDEK